MSWQPNPRRGASLRELAAVSGESRGLAFLLSVEITLGWVAVAGFIVASMCLGVGGAWIAVGAVVLGMDVVSVLPLLVGAHWAMVGCLERKRAPLEGPPV